MDAIEDCEIVPPFTFNGTILVKYKFILGCFTENNNFDLLDGFCGFFLDVEMYLSRSLILSRLLLFGLEAGALVETGLMTGL